MFLIRTLISLVILAAAALAASAQDNYYASTEFRPPFDLAEISQQVSARQHTLGVSSLRSALFVAFHDRATWQEACGWLKTQGLSAHGFYPATPEGSEPDEFMCMIANAYTNVTVDSLASTNSIVEDLLRRFAGSVRQWSFDFNRYSDNPDDSQ